MKGDLVMGEEKMFIEMIPVKADGPTGISVFLAFSAINTFRVDDVTFAQDEGPAKGPYPCIVINEIYNYKYIASAYGALVDKAVLF